LGVGKPEFRPILANALLKLGVERAIVVHGEDGLDEVTTCGRTFVTEVKSPSVGQTSALIEHVWTPSDFGVSIASRDAFDVAGPEESAAVIRKVLANQPGAARDITAVNAAAAIWTAGKVNTLGEGMNLALKAISSGAAAELLARLVQRSKTA
jgi:anthranilate phosphoribosyltransferase